ncbi:MAG: OsmC family protein [Actinomycetota bacterium]|nr:OsmC family protein [Actinomycetota bacterium]
MAEPQGSEAQGSEPEAKETGGSEPERKNRVRLELEEGYRFRAGFGGGRHELVMDEPPPLGEGSGPNASSVLGAAVGHCLSASLLYCLRKAHVDVQGMAADIEVTLARNDRGRLRVDAVRVQLHPQLAPGTEGRVRRCLELFEDFCVVTEAVREGIRVDVDVDASPAR